ncbi:MAG: transcriptional repressor [Bacteroidales bacterium]
MDDSKEKTRHTLSEKGFKNTHQRIGVVDSIHRLYNHPTSENIIEVVRKNHPNIASGTVYKVPDTLGIPTDNLKIK